MKKAIVSALLISVPVFLSFWDLEEKIAEKFPILAPIVYWIPIVCGVLLFLLIVTAVIELMSWWIQLYYRLVPSALKNTSVNLCKSTELEQVLKIAHDKIGSTVDIEKTRELYNHNRRCLFKVVDTKSGNIIGYFCLLPLTEVGQQRVKKHDLLMGDVDLTSFKKRMSKGSAIYIAGIAGLSRKASAAALEYLKLHILKIEASKAYARPVTIDGVRLVKQHGFKPLSEYDEIEEGVYVCRLREF